jgi:predicted metal-binding membrane protein
MTPAARERLHIRLPLVALSGVAWVLLLTQPHALHHSPVAASALMFAAMMVPLMASPLRHVREQSFVRRRLRTFALFVAGYALVWIAAGVVLVDAAMRISAATRVSSALAVILIAAWQCSPAKQRCLNRCHAHSPLSAFGRAADYDVLWFGLTHGFWCMGSCFALMLLPMLATRGHLAAMAAVTLWLAGEKFEKPNPPQWALRGPAKTVRIIAGQAGLWAQRIGRLPAPASLPD